MNWLTWHFHNVGRKLRRQEVNHPLDVSPVTSAEAWPGRQSSSHQNKKAKEKKGNKTRQLLGPGQVMTPHQYGSPPCQGKKERWFCIYQPPTEPNTPLHPLSTPVLTCIVFFLHEHCKKTKQNCTSKCCRRLAAGQAEWKAGNQLPPPASKGTAHTCWVKRGMHAKRGRDGEIERGKRGRKSVGTVSVRWFVGWFWSHLTLIHCGRFG